jgi:hypothetical protein
LVAKQHPLRWVVDTPTENQLDLANQKGFNEIVFPKRDFGLWYQWKGRGGMVKREKEVAVSLVEKHFRRGREIRHRKSMFGRWGDHNSAEGWKALEWDKLRSVPEGQKTLCCIGCKWFNFKWFKQMVLIIQFGSNGPNTICISLCHSIFFQPPLPFQPA